MGPLGARGRRTAKTDEHATFILGAIEAEGRHFACRVTLRAEPGDGPDLHAVAVLRPAPDYAQRKTAPATGQDHPDILKRREEWFDRQLNFDPERLVLTDEAWASADMAQCHGRCRPGERLRSGMPNGLKETTPVAGRRHSGVLH